MIKSHHVLMAFFNDRPYYYGSDSYERLWCRLEKTGLRLAEKGLIRQDVI